MSNKQCRRAATSHIFVYEHKCSVCFQMQRLLPDRNRTVLSNFVQDLRFLLVRGECGSWNKQPWKDAKLLWWLQRFLFTMQFFFFLENLYSRYHLLKHYFMLENPYLFLPAVSEHFLMIFLFKRLWARRMSLTLFYLHVMAS